MMDQKYVRQYKKALMEARKVIESELDTLEKSSKSADLEFEPSLSLPGNLLHASLMNARLLAAIDIDYH